MVGFWSKAIALSDFKNFWFFEISGSIHTTMSRALFSISSKNYRNYGRILVEGDSKNFWFVELRGSSRTTMSPSTFLYLVKKSFEIMVGFWSRAIALSDFKNFWFVELSGSSRTTMSPSTFLYLVKKLSKLWSDFGRGR